MEYDRFIHQMLSPLEKLALWCFRDDATAELPSRLKKTDEVLKEALD